MNVAVSTCLPAVTLTLRPLLLPPPPPSAAMTDIGSAAMSVIASIFIFSIALLLT
ncbi:hypothetical protein QFZ94_004511 [Paraburkholderia sp. JPY465]|uniref:hypothetical protein n=1 Tax=Paraburkholderia sp. JPY465 TaxID=3042285 RepID=UPI003D1A7EAE